MKTALLIAVLLASSWFAPHAVEDTSNSESNMASILTERDASDKVVFLVRHGETCLDQGRNPQLSAFGHGRASELARVLTDVELDVVFSTPFHRTLSTARPVAESQGLEIVETPISSGFLETLAIDIKASNGSFILVAGHSNTTPALVNLLIGTELEDLTENDFDRLYVVTLREDGTGTWVSVRYGLPSGHPEAC